MAIERKDFGIGVVGVGYWGPNIVRNFAGTDGAAVVAVADLDPAKLQKIARAYPGVETTRDVQDLFANPRIDAVVIATPVRGHYALTMAALRAGKHVLVEKPLAETPEQGQEMINEASRRGLVLMVDHTFLYTTAVQKIRQLVESGEIGEIYYYDSTRVNLGLFQGDVNVIWDLAVHDLSIIQYILPDQPIAVSAIGTSHVAGRPENMAHMTLFFESNCVAHINVNWLAPVKVRQTLIGGSRKMIVYDDLETTEKIKVYDKGIIYDPSPENVHQLRVGYRAGDMWAPHLAATEALHTEARHFIDCIENGTKPISDGVAGLRLVEILEAASQSMTLRGQPITLNRRATEPYRVAESA